MTPLLAQRLRADRPFERIYRNHVGDVYRYSLAVLRNSSDAEDVTQTTFLNAYRAYQRGERPRNPQNWLIAIAHNVCRQRFRQAARRPEEVVYDDGIGEAFPEEEHRPSAEDIQRALGHLAFNQRAALVMRELEGRSYAEIAEILDLTVSAVETLIFRARRALREQLQGTLTCGEAERAISKQLDGRLSRVERGALRAHLRECKECKRFARSQRAQRNAIKALGAVPLPTSLTSLFGGGAATAGGGVAVKAAGLVAAGTIAGGVGYEGAKRVDVIPTDKRDQVAAVSGAGTAAPAGSAARVPAARERPPHAGRPVTVSKAESKGKKTQPASPGQQRRAEVAAKKANRTDGRRARPHGANARGVASGHSRADVKSSPARGKSGKPKGAAKPNSAKARKSAPEPKGNGGGRQGNVLPALPAPLPKVLAPAAQVLALPSI